MSLISDIFTIKDFLAKDNLSIPPYQRPYKWTEKNVNQLIDDILENCGNKKSAYRLGTIVFHKESKNGKEVLNIVDGQQRSITLYLLAKALLEYLEDSAKKDCKEALLSANEHLHDYEPKYSLSFSNPISKKNISDNYRLIYQRVTEFDKEAVSFFFKKCELVYVILDDITEAFQFFDSQNSRGKDLEPHDLLKAFHLRAMNNVSTEEEQRNVVEQWHRIGSDNLIDLFGTFLYRIKRWSKGESAEVFTKDDVDTFKGLSQDVHEPYPFASLFRIGSFYTDDYNSSCYSKINCEKRNYPFQIDQPIINGKRFFEMIAYYASLRDKLKHLDEIVASDSEAKRILKMIISYGGATRSTDKITREMFYTALMYYADRFDFIEIEKAVVVIFLWAYRLRLILYKYDLSTIDNYGKGTKHSAAPLFKIIRDAKTPYELINMKQTPILKIEGRRKPSKVNELITYFTNRRCYDIK